MPRRPKSQITKVEQKGDEFTWTFKDDYEGIGASTVGGGYFYKTILGPFSDSFMKMLGIKKK